MCNTLGVFVDLVYSLGFSLMRWEGEFTGHTTVTPGGRLMPLSATAIARSAEGTCRTANDPNWDIGSRAIDNCICGTSSCSSPPRLSLNIRIADRPALRAHSIAPLREVFHMPAEAAFAAGLHRCCSS